MPVSSSALKASLSLSGTASSPSGVRISNQVTEKQAAKDQNPQNRPHDYDVVYQEPHPSHSRSVTQLAVRSSTISEFRVGFVLSYILLSATRHVLIVYPALPYPDSPQSTSHSVCSVQPSISFHSVSNTHVPSPSVPCFVQDSLR